MKMGIPFLTARVAGLHRQLEGIIMTYFHRAALAASAALALSCLVPATAHAQLKPGDSAPAFTLDATLAGKAFPFSDRTSVVKGKRVSVRVSLGGRRIIKKKNSDMYIT